MQHPYFIEKVGREQNVLTYIFALKTASKYPTTSPYGLGYSVIATLVYIVDTNLIIVYWPRKTDSVRQRYLTSFLYIAFLNIV